MNYLLQRKEMPTRYFKILLLFREIVKRANETSQPFYCSSFANPICKYGCTRFFGRPALYYIQGVGFKILWDAFTVPYCS